MYRKEYVGRVIDEFNDCFMNDFLDEKKYGDYVKEVEGGGGDLFNC